ncbi:hypothetical protein [Cellulomonas denverensis]|uniref:DUF559 domain-containing protein n=1 Tax=Cellulomonas denverensis TaxID=264297 RepID=A0A7X6QYC7_9CELL|nr:hypothetical protein [Cellulomonas denverensis]NKY21999.1 hypothetical protein [Cellulomonas denverensis]GIG24108.1 hypothetical protein Cde04nite_03520 [Cellulomonas denverensis]
MDQVFTVAQGRARGVGAARLRVLRRPIRGVRATGAPPMPDDVAARCRELRPVLPRSAVFSHATAIALLGVDRPEGLSRPEAIHIQVTTAGQRPHRSGVVAHTGLPSRSPVMLRHGLPVIMPEALWLQLAGELTVDELVVLGDALIRRRAALSSVRELSRAAERMPARSRGRRRALEALPLLRAGTDSCPESRLRLLIVRAGLGCPEVNRPVFDRMGRFVARPDLSYSNARIAIEYDGDLHRTDRRTWRRDVARRRAVESLGWRMLTCTADDLRAPAEFLTQLRAALR